MSADAAFIAAEKIHAQNIGAPGTLVIDGLRCPARIYTERGLKYTEQGGQIQQRKLNAVILCAHLPKARVQTAAGETRAVVITHLESSTDYRLDPGGLDRSPRSVYWTLEASQVTAQK